MTVYSSCSEWAVAQKTGSPDFKLLLVLLAFDIDMGEPGATAARLGRRAEMASGNTVYLAIHELLSRSSSRSSEPTEVTPSTHRRDGSDERPLADFSRTTTR